MIKFKYILFLFLGIVIFLGCASDDDNVYGPENPDPYPGNWDYAVLTEIVPDSATPGTEIVIKGAGFFSSTSFEDTPPFVWFGVDTATVVEMKPNEIKVIVPFSLKNNLPDSTYSGVTNVKVALFGSYNWSNELSFKYISLIGNN